MSWLSGKEKNIHPQHFCELLHCHYCHLLGTVTYFSLSFSVTQIISSQQMRNSSELCNFTRKEGEAKHKHGFLPQHLPQKWEWHSRGQTPGNRCWEMLRNGGAPWGHEALPPPRLAPHTGSPGSAPGPRSPLSPPLWCPDPPPLTGGRRWETRGGGGNGCRNAASAGRRGCQPLEHFPAREQIRGKRWMGTLVTADGGFDLKKKARGRRGGRIKQGRGGRLYTPGLRRSPPRASRRRPKCCSPQAWQVTLPLHPKNLLTFPRPSKRQCGVPANLAPLYILLTLC